MKNGHLRVLKTSACGGVVIESGGGAKLSVQWPDVLTE